MGYRAGRVVRAAADVVRGHSIAFAILAFGLMMAITFRYEYISREAGAQGAYILKVDRLTGRICYITEAQEIGRFIDDQLTFVACPR